MYVYASVCLCVKLDGWIVRKIDVRVCVCMCACASTCVDASLSVYVYMHIHICSHPPTRPPPDRPSWGRGRVVSVPMHDLPTDGRQSPLPNSIPKFPNF